MSSNGKLYKYCGKLYYGKNLSVKKINIKVDITAVMCVIFFWHFVFSKISSINMYCFCDQKKHSLYKSLDTNYIMKLHAHCHSLHSKLRLCSKATAKYTDLKLN